MSELEKIEAGVRRFRAINSDGRTVALMKAVRITCGSLTGKLRFALDDLGKDKTRHFADFDAAYRALRAKVRNGGSIESYEYEF